MRSAIWASLSCNRNSRCVSWWRHNQNREVLQKQDIDAQDHNGQFQVFAHALPMQINANWSILLVSNIIVFLLKLTLLDSNSLKKSFLKIERKKRHPYLRFHIFSSNPRVQNFRLGVIVGSFTGRYSNKRTNHFPHDVELARKITSLS